jgi:hypothetical protein
VIDVKAGVIRYFELRTAWQSIEIHSLGMEFDDDAQTLRIVAPGTHKRH